MAVEQVAVHGLREDVGGVVRPWVLAELEVPRPDSLLHPELPRGQVPDAADARPPADADGSAAVCEQLQARAEAEVAGDSHEAKTLGCPFDDAGELGLP